VIGSAARGSVRPYHEGHARGFGVAVEMEWLPERAMITIAWEITIVAPLTFSGRWYEERLSGRARPASGEIWLPCAESAER